MGNKDYVLKNLREGEIYPNFFSDNTVGIVTTYFNKGLPANLLRKGLIENP